MVTSGVRGCQVTPKMGQLKPVIRLAISVNFMIASSDGLTYSASSILRAAPEPCGPQVRFEHRSRRIGKWPSNQMSNYRQRHQWTPADTDGQSFAGQACRSAAGPHHNLASGRRGRHMSRQDKPPGRDTA